MPNKNSKYEKFVIELSERLADEPDYEGYLLPKLEQLLELIKENNHA